MHDSSTGRKHAQAQALIEKLWDDGTGVISTQVLQELRVTLQRKISPPLDWTEAVEIIEDYLTWHLVVNDGRSILEALRWKDSFAFPSGTR